MKLKYTPIKKHVSYSVYDSVERSFNRSVKTHFSFSVYNSKFEKKFIVSYIWTVAWDGVERDIREERAKN